MAVRVVNVFAPNNENHLLDLVVRGDKIARRFERNMRGLLSRITGSAATDRRKRYCFDLVFHRKLQRIAVAICQYPRFVMFSAAPDRADSVNHKASGQVITAGDFRLAGFATGARTAFGKQFRSRRAVNRSIDTTTTEERRVCRVHDRIDRELCDIAAEDFNSVVGILYECSRCPQRTICNVWAIAWLLR